VPGFSEQRQEEQQRQCPAGRLQGSCACSYTNISRLHDAAEHSSLHEGPAEEGDQDHGQPGGHLGESPGNVSVGNGEAVLLESAVEGVEDALIREDLVKLVVNDKLLECLGGSRGAVQLLEANLRNGRGLVGQRLGNAQLDQRWRADRPRVAEDILPLAIDEAKLGRRGLSGDDGNGCL
jgi:hypothetical protein